MPSVRGFINALNNATELFELESSVGVQTVQRTSLAPMPCVVDIGEITATPRTDPPPAYLETQDSTSRAILQILTDGVPEPPEAIPDEVERLRDFLFHCLAKDYKIENVPELSQADTTHFLRLGQSIFDIMSGKVWYPAYTGEAGEQMCYFLDRFIYGPAGVLNIPPKSVIAMISLFRRTIGYDRVYSGAWDGVPCIHAMAKKLLIDRDVIITGIVPATSLGLRRTLLHAVEEMQETHFASLTDSNVFTLTEYGVEFEESRIGFKGKSWHIFRALPLPSCHVKISETVVVIKFLNSFRGKRKKYLRNYLRRLLKLWEEDDAYGAVISSDSAEDAWRKSRTTCEGCKMRLG